MSAGTSAPPSHVVRLDDLRTFCRRLLEVAGLPRPGCGPGRRLARRRGRPRHRIPRSPPYADLRRATQGRAPRPRGGTCRGQRARRRMPRRRRQRHRPRRGARRSRPRHRTRHPTAPRRWSAYATPTTAALSRTSSAAPPRASSSSSRRRTLRPRWCSTADVRGRSARTRSRSGSHIRPDRPSSSTWPPARPRAGRSSRPANSAWPSRRTGPSTWQASRRPTRSWRWPGRYSRLPGPRGRGWR